MGKYESIAETEEQYGLSIMPKQEQALVGWVVEKVNSWCDYRDTNYLSKWDEYYRLWRGVWSTADRNRESERSKLISPALQQAIESVVAEIEEATFGREIWFDLDDDVRDEDKQDVLLMRDLLLDDFDRAGIQNEVSKVFLNGALYGTGIGKLLVERKTEMEFVPDPFTGQAMPQEVERYQVRVEAIDPREFAIDPAARSIEESVGVAHVFVKPTHTIKQKQREGIYKDYPLGAFIDDSKLKNLGDDDLASYTEGKTKIIEYYGLVPRSLLPVEVGPDEEIVDLGVENKEEGVQNLLRLVEDDEMVEAIVTIANDKVLLRAVENTFMMKDRPIIAYQHDVVPHKFWGRGVAEKGYNPQKALDAELRARIDALALATHPMMAVDATRVPRGTNMTVKPGKVWLTNGDPNSVLMPFNFGAGVNAATFHQSGDLERMIQMGTGAMDSATPISINPRNQTASGMSMIQSGFIKRSKRSMQNISRQFLEPLIRKAAWRYMQFDPENYPVRDFKFKVVTTMGIMAREYEQAQLTQLLSVVPPDSPAFAILLKGIFDNSSIPNKAEMLEAVEQMLQPDPQEQQMAQMAAQLQMATAQAEVGKLQAEIEKLKAQVVEILNGVQIDQQKVQIEARRATLEGVRAYGETARLENEIFNGNKQKSD